MSRKELIEVGNWRVPVNPHVLVEESGQHQSEWGMIDYVKLPLWDEEGVLFRYPDRKFMPKIGWVGEDRWLTMELTENNDVNMTLVSGKKGLSVVVNKDGIEQATAAVSLPENRPMISRELVLDISREEKIYSYIRETNGGFVEFVDFIEHGWGKKNFWIVASEMDLANKEEVLRAYNKQKDVNLNPQLSIYHVGIKKDPDNLHFWVTRWGESLSWKLGWEFGGDPEYLRHLNEVSFTDFPQAFVKLSSNLGVIGFNSPIGKKLKTDGS